MLWMQAAVHAYHGHGEVCSFAVSGDFNYLSVSLTTFVRKKRALAASFVFDNLRMFDVQARDRAAR